MRVLHVVTLIDHHTSYGGALAVAVNQCLELRHRGHDARIVAGWRGREQPPAQLDGVPAHLFRVYPVAPGLGSTGLFSPALPRWVHDHAGSFDVAHLHLARDLVPLSVARALRRAEVPYVVQTHGALWPARSGLERLLDSRLTQRALLSARHIFVLTPEERDAVARIAGSTEGISLLRHGVVLPDRVPVRHRGGTVDVLFLGRLQPNRRVLAFAAAAQRLIEDGVEARFSVVGPDGGDLKALRRFILDRPQLHGRLRYEGVLPHDRAVERLRRCDLFVLPSVDNQAYPMSLLEAMAAGVPSICTTACVLAGTLAREQAAIVANPSDDALYGAMRRMLTDPGARARLSVRAAATATSVFSMTPVAEALEEEYGLGRTRPSKDGPRLSLLWVSDEATAPHVQVWDTLRADTDLTVALLQPVAPRPGGGSAERIRPGELVGRGYPVVEVLVTGDGAPTALRAMIRNRPDVVILEREQPDGWEVLRRWARRSGVQVVTASPLDEPAVTAARATRAARSARAIPAAAAPGRRVTLSLDVRPNRTASDAGQPPAPDVIDLQQRTRRRRPV